MTVSIDAQAAISRMADSMESQNRNGTQFTKMPKTLEGLNKELNTTVSNPTLNAIINLAQGRIGNSQVNVNIPGRRLNLNVPFGNVGGGLISGQGSYSPYGANSIGLTYDRPVGGGMLSTQGRYGPYGNNYLGIKYSGNW